jgi:uncharacterized protein involved in outer membrane biogenesis
MKKIVLWVGGIFATLLLSVSALAAYVVFVLDPNDYKDELTAVVKDKTDMDLLLSGDLAWQLYPSVGIRLGETAFSDPDQAEPLLAVDSASVSVELMPLLAGQVNIDEVLLDGARIRFVQLAEGKTNWDRLIEKLKSDDKEEDSGAVKLAVEVVDIKNTQLILIDDVAQVTRELSNVRLRASSIDLETAFPLSLGFDFEQTDANKDTIIANVSLDTTAKVNLEAQQHQLSDATLSVGLSGSGIPAPTTLTATVGQADADITNNVYQVDALVATVIYADPNLVKPAEIKLQTALKADLAKETVNVNQLTIDASYQDKGRPAPITAKLSSDVVVSLKNNQANLSNIIIDAVLADAAIKGTLPAKVTADLAANWKTGEIQLSKLQAKAANIQLAGGVNVSLPALASGKGDVTDGMRITGRLATNTFNPRELMKIAGMDVPVTANPNVLKQVSLRTDLSGNEREYLARNLTLKLDGSTISGEAGVRELPNSRLYARLNLDAINVDHYLPPEQPATKAKPAAAKTTQEQAEGLLPVALLRDQNLDIGLTAGSLEVITYPIRQLRLAATARNGLVNVSELRGNIEGGSFSLPMTIDVRAAKPQISLSPVLKDIDLGPIAKRSLEQDVFTGRMNFNGNVKVSGNSVDEWVKSAQGPNTLRLNEGLIKGINIGDALLNAMGQYQALLPALTGRDAASIQGKKIRDTEIVSLLGEVSLNQGVVKNESMKADLKDIQVGGSGTYNLETQDVDYRFQLKLDRKFWGERYAKMSEYPIPVRCNGSLKGSLATLCGLDSQGMQGLVAQMAKARVAEEVDRGKQQLQERLNEKLGDKLDPAQQEAVKQLFDVFKR